MVLGERRSVKVECEDAFGYALKNRIVNVSIFEFAEEVEVGERLGIQGELARQFCVGAHAPAPARHECVSWRG
jgi:FKBP-type peptidyl-prolyl cis-trans isomerase 2